MVKLSEIKLFLSLKGHAFISGMTQSGKTHFTKFLMNNWKGPVLFFNPQEEKTDFILADARADITDIIKLLYRGVKLDYRPHGIVKIGRGELDVLLSAIMLNPSWSNLLIVIDESQDFVGEGSQSYGEVVARRGLGRGITGYFIAQRPADVSKVVVSQCLHHFYFRPSGYDKEYFRRKGIPFDDIDKKISAGGEHSFVYWDGKLLKGPYKL